MKLFSNDISNQLFKLPFSLGASPSILKTGKVISIFKNESKLKYSSFGPISLLCHIEEILEENTYNCLNKSLELHSLTYDLQFGFRQKRSASHELIHLSEKIKEQLDNISFSCGIFVEFQKVFNTVDNDIFIEKTNYYGISGTANNWFSSYLESRTQFSSINSHLSDLHFIHCVVFKVPFWVFFFLNFTNDQHYAVKYCEVYHHCI